MRKLFSSTLALIILLTILLAVWIVCHALIEMIPIEYVRPTATGLLFVWALNEWGNHKEKERNELNQNKEDE